MKILIACEESQVVTQAFRSKGHDAYSCDLLPTRGNPDWHITGDAREACRKPWDMIIAFPPCTHLAVSGARWFKDKIADGRQKKAIDFFMFFANLSGKVAIENPVSIMSTKWRKPDQIIQPWQYGHGEIKATCLWLQELPELMPTNVVSGRDARVHKMAPGPERSRDRSVTYQGIADAMAEQWG